MAVADTEGTLLFNHNATEAVGGSDQRVIAELDLIRSVDPDAGYLSEAYGSLTSQIRIDSFLEDVQRMGYAVDTHIYTRPDEAYRHGSISFARPDLIVKPPTYPEFNGRTATETVLIEESSGRRYLKLDFHASSTKRERGLEVDRLLLYYGRRLMLAEPFLLDIDLNNAEDGSAFALLAHALGTVARTGSLPELARQDETNEHHTLLGRLASIFIRADDQLDAEDITKLLEYGWLKSANVAHERTSFVPQLPPKLERLVRLIPAIGAWLLDQPHIEADYFLANVGQFSDFRTYPRQPEDEHLATSVRYSLLVDGALEP